MLIIMVIMVILNIRNNFIFILSYGNILFIFIGGTDLSNGDINIFLYDSGVFVVYGSLITNIAIYLLLFCFIYLFDLFFFFFHLFLIQII